MAKVLSSWLPEGFMRPSLASRTSKRNMVDDELSAPDELAMDEDAKQNVNGTHGESEQEEEQDAEGEPDDDNEDEDGDAGVEDEYHDAAAGDDTDMEATPSSSRRRRLPQKSQAQSRSSRRRAAEVQSDSQSDGSVAGTSEDEEEEEEDDEEAAWDAEDDAIGEDEDHDAVELTQCMSVNAAPRFLTCARADKNHSFCGQDENNDPGEEYEEILTCSHCGSKAHRQCARDANLLDSDDDAIRWQCANCLENGDDPAQNDPDLLQQQRRGSAPKIARDLLPYQRGAPKPGSHSIFNTLIVEDDPMDGSRALRKRKSSVEEDEKTDSRKRQRRATSEVNKSTYDRAPTPFAPAPAVEDQPVPASPPASRPNRSSRGTRRSERPLVTVIEPRTDETLTLAFHLGSEKLRSMDDEKRKRKRREKNRQKRQLAHEEIPDVNHYPALQPTSFVFQSLFDRDGDESKSKPYGGILNEEEADTTRTFPQSADRKKFEDARQKAEEDWRKKIEAQREAEAARTVHKTSGPPSKVKCINFAGFEIDTWHAAPYPEEYSRNRVLYICEFCLKYMNSDFVAWRHKLKCPAKHPPGDEIYREGSISFFEVDGRKNPVYCQNLCLLAKLFLGSKTLYYDVEPFLFYIMTEYDEFGCHFVGYFSKEKRPSSQNNVSCILVLPIHQRRGFGNLLIEFSYLLTRVEGKSGSPEKPLSDMGLVTYRAYWRLVMCHELLKLKEPLSIATLSERTGMTADDIVCALEGLRALVRDPVTKTYALRLDYAFFKRYIDNYDSKGYIKLNPQALIWEPYVMGRDNMHYENAAPLHTVAQRDEDAEEGNAASSSETADKKIGEATSTTHDIEGSGPEKEEDVTPFPALESSDKPSSPSTRVMPTTPFVDNPSQPSSPIPATRFEVFPPLPGTAGRKYRGRLPRNGRRYTSTVNGLSFTETPHTNAHDKPSTLRHGRSQLAEEVTGDEVVEDAEGEPDDPDSPAAGRGANAVDEAAGMDVEMQDVEE